VSPGTLRIQVGVARGFLVLGLVLSCFLEPAATSAGSSLPSMDSHGLLESRVVELSYRVDVPRVPRGAHQLSMWIPLPRETAVQHVDVIGIESDFPTHIVRDPDYGNRFLYMEAEPAPQGLHVTMEYVIRREGYEVRRAGTTGLPPKVPGKLDSFLRPDRLIPIDGAIAARAATVLSDAGIGTFERARLLYDDVLRTMKYDKTGDGWGRGDAVYACTVGAGNCTDFHSLFIGMARASGIPARFVMGLPVPAGQDEGEIRGYHCWAEFHDERLGWVPLDASEAWKQPDAREFLFGGLDPNRLEFTIGRDIPLVPEDKAAGALLNYSIYPHVVVDGAVYDGAVTTLSFRDLTGEDGGL